jgi:hypothetical protein
MKDLVEAGDLVSLSDARERQEQNQLVVMQQYARAGRTGPGVYVAAYSPWMSPSGCGQR